MITATFGCFTSDSTVTVCGCLDSSVLNSDEMFSFHIHYNNKYVTRGDSGNVVVAQVAISSMSWF